MNLVEDQQLAPFRTEYLEREKEIQRYIGVYLSGVVIVFSWILGPQAKPLNEIALGNDGYNIYAFLIFSVVNALFMTFLIYKSLDVHDTTQFITVLAKPSSLYAFWEDWRRSKHSATKPVRTLYFIALALLPTIIAITLLFFAGSKLFASDDSLKNQLVRIETAHEDVRVTSPGANQSSGPIPQSTAPALSAVEVSAQLANVTSVFRTARIFFVLVIGLHFIPISFFWHNTVPTKRRWTAIAELKNAQARSVSPCSPEALQLETFISNSGMTERNVDLEPASEIKAGTPSDGST
jgi:hypothetical protein